LKDLQPHGQQCACGDGTSGTAVTLRLPATEITPMGRTNAALTAWMCVLRHEDRNQSDLEACELGARVTPKGDACTCGLDAKGTGRAFKVSVPLVTDLSAPVRAGVQAPAYNRASRPTPEFFGDRPQPTIDAGAQSEFLKRLRECCR